MEKNFVDCRTGSLVTYELSTDCTYTDKDIEGFETIFCIPILETGWIFNVFLVIDGQYIPATHILRAYDLSNHDNIYSFFGASYVFKFRKRNQEAHWCYTIENTMHVSKSIFFDVLD